MENPYYASSNGTYDTNICPKTPPEGDAGPKSNRSEEMLKWAPFMSIPLQDL